MERNGEWFWFSTEWKRTGEDLTSIAGQHFVLDRSPLNVKVLLDHFVFELPPNRATLPKAEPAPKPPSTARPKVIMVVVTRTTPSVELYVLSESGIIGETSTIFKVVEEYGETTFFKLDATHTR